MSNELILNTNALKQAAFVYRAINNKLRQQILQFIHKRQRVIVTEIYKKLKIEQSVASQHLAILRLQGIVTTEREGKFIYYTVNYKRVEQLHQLAERLNTIK